MTLSPNSQFDYLNYGNPLMMDDEKDESPEPLNLIDAAVYLNSFLEDDSVSDNDKMQLWMAWERSIEDFNKVHLIMEKRYNS